MFVRFHHKVFVSFVSGFVWGVFSPSFCLLFVSVLK